MDRVNPEENLDLFKQLLLTKTCISPQIEPHTAKLCVSVSLKHFWRNSHRSTLFIPIMTISEKFTEIIRKVVFLNKFDKGQILRKNWISFMTKIFDQISKMR